MLLKACRRCGKLITYGNTYCDECRPIVEAARQARNVANRKAANKRYNKRRDPKYTRFYGSAAWRMLSAKRLLNDGYRCRECGKVATEVDHIIPIQTTEGWERRLDYDNTQSLCHGCHDKKHGRFIKKNNNRL